MVAAVLAAPATALAHRPTKRAIQSDAVAAARTHAQQAGLALRDGPVWTWHVRRWQGHGRCASVSLPVFSGRTAAVYSGDYCWNIDTGRTRYRWLGTIA